MTDSWQLPSQMNAWVVTKSGNPSDESLVLKSCPAPSKATEANVIVKIQFVALNQTDVDLMQSTPSSRIIPFRRCTVPGLDFSGHIVAKGPFAPAFMDVGDEVCGVLSTYQVATGKGSLAEYLEVPAATVVARPLSLNMAACAGLGLVSQAAITMLQTRPVKRGERIVVNGASGGVGAVLTQILKSKNAFVVGVCSQSNMEAVKNLGADDVLDYTDQQPIYEILSSRYGDGIDVVFDCAGCQSLYKNSAGFLKASGSYVNIVGANPISHYCGPMLKRNMLPERLGGGPRRYRAVHLSPSADLQREAVRLTDEGIIREVPIDSMFAMDHVVEAYSHLLSSKVRGKVIVKL